MSNRLRAPTHPTEKGSLRGGAPQDWRSMAEPLKIGGWEVSRAGGSPPQKKCRRACVGVRATALPALGPTNKLRASPLLAPTPGRRISEKIAVRYCVEDVEWRGYCKRAQGRGLGLGMTGTKERRELDLDIPNHMAASGINALMRKTTSVDTPLASTGL